MNIRKSIAVRCPPEQAFRIFTREIRQWWPLDRGFSFGRERAKEIFLDDREGGRLYERFMDGSEFEIGRVTRCEPPHLILFSWKAPDWPVATEVEVHFIAEASGTRVELEHRGWEGLPNGKARSKGFTGGWDIVLGQFAGHADREDR
jgi:uncharacterized protein YndB with AHSA1/START domain